MPCCDLVVIHITYLSYILNNADIDFDSSTLLSEAIIGAFAGGCGAFLTNPTDIITTRIITQSVDEEDIIDEDGNIISKPPLGVIEMANNLYKEGGPAAFFVGWQARVGYWKVRLVLFYYVHAGVQYKGSTTLLLYLTSVCLCCLPTCLSYVLTYIIISSLLSS